MSANNKARRRRISAIALGIVLLIISMTAYLIMILKNKVELSVTQTYTLDLGELSKSVHKDAVIIRGETLIKSKSSGEVSYFFKQGERVAKNSVVAKVQVSKTKENEFEELQNIENKLQSLLYKNDENDQKNQLSNIESNIGNLYYSIQEKIDSSQIFKVRNYKEELARELERKQVILGGEKYSKFNVSQLEAKKKELEHKINSSSMFLKAPVSGRVTYEKDKNMDKFSFKNIYKLRVKDIKAYKDEVKEMNKENVAPGDPVCIIVNNHFYYLATEVDKADIENIHRNQKIEIKFDEGSVDGYLYDFYKDIDGKFVGLFKVETETYDFLKDKQKSVDIIYKKAKGILIPNTAIVKQGGKQGVFTVDAVGNAHFKELDNILISDSKNTLIKFSYDDLSERSKVKLYDEVILSPNKIKDGQKVK